MERLADELPIEQVAKRWIVASDPDDAVEQIKTYLDAGLNHLVFHNPGHDQRRFLGRSPPTSFRSSASWPDMSCDHSGSPTRPGGAVNWGYGARIVARVDVVMPRVGGLGRVL